MQNQRKIALYALIDVGQNFGYSNLILKKAFDENNVSNDDKPFITALFYGVLDRLITLDYVISLFVKKPLKRIKPVTLYSMRMAVYQILYMDKVPLSAAVNEAVSIVKSSRESYNAPFVNAVLRTILREGVKLPEGDTVKDLKIRYSCPEWIIESLIADYGIETAVSVLKHYLTVPEIALRINPGAIGDDELLGLLLKAGINARLGDFAHLALISGGVDIKKLPEYSNGYFHAQDIPSQAAVKALVIKPGSRILDLCAAPGGKTFTAAEYAGENAEVFSCDLYESRVELIKSGAKRLGLENIKCFVNDSGVYNEKFGSFDYVICDVPCSGIGVIRRKPEIKYKTDLDFKALTNTQLAIARNGIKYLKPGGRMMYSTCTLRAAENGDIVRYFLSNNKNLSLLDEHTFLPDTDGTDGFYYAIIQKSSD